MPKAGKVHALNAGSVQFLGHGYVRLCDGKFIRATYEHPTRFGETITAHVRRADGAAGEGVTCTRCRRMLAKGGGK
jgi:hypothetical protein